jgi:RecA-family ATPase
MPRDGSEGAQIVADVRGHREAAQSKLIVEKEPTKPGWTFTSPTTLQDVVVPERRFVVHGWAPYASVTVFYGDGGVGKTLLTQQLMTSATVGHAWCGLAVDRCNSLALFCEDDEDELHRRQHAINRAYGVEFSDLDGMEWISGVGEDNTLVTFDIDGIARPTAGFGVLLNRAIETKPGLIIIDTAADTFGGNEILRRQVRQYVGHILGKLARDTGAAVVLNAHPSRTGMSATGDMDGGSTAWSNTARTRWSLARPKVDGDEQPDTNERILTRRKANYASIGDTIKLRWQNGVLVPTDAPTGLAALAGRQDAETTFLALLARCDAENRPVSDSRNAGNAAPKLFALRPDRQGYTRRDFEGAMQRLFAAGKITMQPYGRRSDMRHRIAAVQDA